LSGGILTNLNPYIVIVSVTINRRLVEILLLIKSPVDACRTPPTIYASKLEYNVVVIGVILGVIDGVSVGEGVIVFVSDGVGVSERVAVTVFVIDGVMVVVGVSDLVGVIVLDGVIGIDNDGVSDGVLDGVLDGVGVNEGVLVGVTVRLGVKLGDTSVGVIVLDGVNDAITSNILGVIEGDTPTSVTLGVGDSVSV